MHTLLPMAELREAFPGIVEDEVYLDTAATAQKPLVMFRSLQHAYVELCANVHRGLHRRSEMATEAFEDARDRLTQFIGAEDAHELIFTSGATEGLNLVATALGAHVLKPGDRILATVMEHHANLVPWQMAAARHGATVHPVRIREDYRLDLEHLEQELEKGAAIVACTQASNTLGTINPLADVVSRAHAVGALVVSDGAQYAGHNKPEVLMEGIDAYAFSGHKMYGPFGTGGVWVRRELLEAMPPYMGGGEMIRSVSFDQTEWNEIPYKFEAGTPNIAGTIALADVVDWVSLYGWEYIHDHEQALVKRALKGLGSIPGVRTYGPRGYRVPVVTFNVDGIHPHDLGTLLDEQGIAIRTGHHCNQPLMEFLGVAATARASFGLYTTADDVDRFLEAVESVRARFGGAR